MRKTDKPYLIALDMDGTLLNSKKKISFKTAHYLRKLTKMGHHVVIASGRPKRSIECYYKQLKLNDPIIGYNGEYIYSDNSTDFKTVRHEIPKDAILEVINELGKNVCNIMCETDNEIWIDKKDDYLKTFFWYDGMKVNEGDLNKTLDKDTMTCIIHVHEELRDSGVIEKICEKWSDIVSIFWIGHPYVELHHKNASKGDALKVIAKHYDIPSERVIAFGDATNDVEMFEFAKTSVLMSNAKYDIKEKATMVSLKDNDHNGIYYTLKKILH